MDVGRDGIGDAFVSWQLLYPHSPIRSSPWVSCTRTGVCNGGGAGASQEPPHPPQVRRGPTRWHPRLRRAPWLLDQ
eukprot:126565-Prorocentrum_minimum.AAC.1